MSVMAELLDGSRCYLVRRYSSWPREHYVSWGPAAPPKGGGTQQPSTFWPRYCIQTAGWIKMPLGVEVGLGPDHIVLGGDPAPPFLLQKQDTPIFGACLLWTNGCMVQHAIIRCLHEAIVAAIGRATDRRDRLHVCLHDAIVAAIGRATDRRDRSRDRLHVCLHGAIVAAIGRAISRATDRAIGRATIVWL